MEDKIIVNANGYDMELPRGYNKEYNLSLFCKLIYYGYKSITINGVDSTPDEVKKILRSQ